LEDASFLERWSERQLIIIYICFHWITRTDISYDTLIHSPYLGTLPSPDRLRTRCTSPRGARRAERNEPIRLRPSTDVGLGKRCGNSVLRTSRPSTPCGERAHLPVSWVVSTHHPPPNPREPYPSSRALRWMGMPRFPTTMVPNQFRAAARIGFTLPDNPDDTIVLKIGGGAGDDTTRHEVGRGARAQTACGAPYGGPEGTEDGDAPEWQTVLDAADMLRSMTEALLARLPNVPVSGALRTDNRRHDRSLCIMAARGASGSGRIRKYAGDGWSGDGST
ncbi:hypothetical protein EDB84DRAFT_1632855, partial [Lactarius hengduanensis]